MYISEFLLNKHACRITNLNATSNTYKISYNYWIDNLFERAMRLFIWKCDGVEQKEIESRLLLNGSCGITNKFNDRLTAYFGSITGITEYYDEGTHYCVYSPKYSGSLKIDDEVIIISNNSLRNASFPLIHQYAVMLAHTDVTITSTLVNMRDSGGVPVAGTTKVSESIKQYRSSLYEGKINTIIDPAFINAKFVESHTNMQSDIADLIECRRNLLNDFYSDIGVKTSWNKKGNMIVEEVQADNSMLLLNISDMLAERRKGCEKVNNKYGTNWTVSLNPELEYAKDGVNDEEETK